MFFALKLLLFLFRVGLWVVRFGFLMWVLALGFCALDMRFQLGYSFEFCFVLALFLVGFSGCVVLCSFPTDCSFVC